MIRSLIRIACWLSVYGGVCQLIGLLGVWTGFITVELNTRIGDVYWRLADPVDAIKILAISIALTTVGLVGLRLIPKKQQKKWMLPE